MEDEFRIYRGWFYAAVLYNAGFAAWSVGWPDLFLRSAAMDRSAAPLAQCIGMMVGVYAYGYYLLARDPRRYARLIWVGLAGKMLGAIGYAACAIAGTVPARFGYITLLNDLIWLPVFWRFALRYARD